MIRESRVVADLLFHEVFDDEWDKAIEVENRLQKRTSASAKRIARTLRQRLELL